MTDEYTKEDCAREDEHKARWKDRKLEERNAVRTDATATNGNYSMTDFTLEFSRYTMQEHRQWSQSNFGTPKERGPVGCLRHLAKEAIEAAENPTNVEEYADCAFLLLDALWRAGISGDQLREAMSAKMKVLHATDSKEIYSCARTLA